MPTYQNVSSSTQIVIVARPTLSYEIVVEPLRFLHLAASDLEFINVKLEPPIWLDVDVAPPPPPPIVEDVLTTDEVVEGSVNKYYRSERVRNELMTSTIEDGNNRAPTSDAVFDAIASIGGGGITQGDLDAAIAQEVIDRDAAIAAGVSSANGYTDNRMSQEILDRNAAVSSSAADTLSSANNYTDIAIAGIGGGSSTKVVVKLTPTQIHAIDTTPIELIPAPGVGKIVALKNVSAAIKLGSTSYNFSGGGLQITMANSILVNIYQEFINSNSTHARKIDLVS